MRPLRGIFFLFGALLLVLTTAWLSTHARKFN